jgi:nitrile hydratase
MGGMQGFGPVRPEPNEPCFHAPWERRVLALTLAMGATGRWNLDMSRAARESIPPARYLAATYYEIWYEGLCRLLVAKGLATEDELRDGRVRMRPAADVPRLVASDVPARLAAGTPTARPASAAPRFALGDAVRARAMNPPTHTRLPRYCRGKRGTIVATHGAHVFADTHATGRGEAPQWLYTVSFDARELWGDDTTASRVRVDCWESYLEKG